MCKAGMGIRLTDEKQGIKHECWKSNRQRKWYLEQRFGVYLTRD